jgi:hypothetical protein
MITNLVWNSETFAQISWSFSLCHIT